MVEQRLASCGTVADSKKLYQKMEVILDLSVKALKVIIYLQEDLHDGGFFSVKLQV